MVTAFGSIELAVDAMKAGARDFLEETTHADSAPGRAAGRIVETFASI